MFSFQFPVAATVVPSPEPTQGFGGAWGSLPMQRTFDRKAAEAAQRIEAGITERAAEIAEATVARAAATEAPASLADVMQVWVMPASLSALVAEPVNPSELLRASSRLPEPAAAPSLAALDEDAILAASMLLMRRRKA